MILGLSEGAWSDEDRLLTIALQTHEEGLCSGCGHPRERTYDDPKIEGEFEVSKHVCEACATVQRHQATHKDKTPEPGEKLAVQDTTLSEP